MANAWIIKPLPIVSVSAIVSAAPTPTALGDPSYIGVDYAGIIWQSSNSDVATLTIDLGADSALDTIALFGLVGATMTTAVIQVAIATAAQGSSFNGSNVTTGAGSGNYWAATQALLAGTQLPVNGKGVMLWSAPATGGPPAAARYVRLSVQGLGSANSIQISRAVIGKRIQLGRNFSYGAGFGVRDLGSVDFSRRGVLLRVRGAKLRTCQLTFSNVRKDEVEAMTKPLLEQIGNTETIALITDPGADAQRMNRCYFGTLVGDLAHTWRNPAAWEAKINLVSFF